MYKHINKKFIANFISVNGFSNLLSQQMICRHSETYRMALLNRDKTVFMLLGFRQKVKFNLRILTTISLSLFLKHLNV